MIKDTSYRVTKIRLFRKPIIYGLLVIISLLYSGHALGASSNRLYAVCSFFIGVFGLFLVVSESGKNFVIRLDNNKKHAFSITIIWGVIIFVNYFAHFSSESFNSYILWISYALFALGIYFFVGEDVFCKTYVKIIFSVCVISLIFFLIIQKTAIFNVFGWLNGTAADGWQHKYHGFIAYYSLDPLRNSGPFWEPGIFASHISFATIIHLSREKKPNTWYILIFLITMLTTVSAAGYVLILLLVLFYISKNQVNNNSKNSLFAVLTIIFIVFLLYLYSHFEEIAISLGLINNLSVKKLIAISENSRSISLSWCFERFLEKPLFGYGIGGFSNLSDQALVKVTTSSTKLLAVLGIGGISYTLFLLIGVFRQKNLSYVTKIVLASIFLAIINKEGHDFFVATWILIYILYGNNQFFAKDDVVINNLQQS